MVKSVSLSISAEHYASLKSHLFPADGCEAVAFALCGRMVGSQRHKLLVQKIALLPYSECSVRAPDRVTWPTRLIEPLLEEAGRRSLALVKLHGHRGYDRFSSVDDESDRALFPSVSAWLDDDQPHASAIIMDDGSMFGRVAGEAGQFASLSQVCVVGDDLLFWHSDRRDHVVPAAARKIAQAFGEGTYDKLKKLHVGVVGCSGTGSVLIEQLARNCVGRLTLVDPDRVEEKNLNRILNSSVVDAQNGISKVQVARQSIERIGLGTEVRTIEQSLFSIAAVKAIAECDVVFGCMDSIDGRHILNRLATFYLLPYFDLGVKLEADGMGGVEQVCGTVHYLQPGGSSLFSRGVFTMEQVRAAGMLRSDPAGYKALLKDGYIRGVHEERPAVIQLNSLVASLAVNELMARLHPYRLDSNAEYAVHRISLSHGIYDHERDGVPCQALARHVGRGDVSPLLDYADLSSELAAA